MGHYMLVVLQTHLAGVTSLDSALLKRLCREGHSSICCFGAAKSVIKAVRCLLYVVRSSVCCLSLGGVDATRWGRWLALRRAGSICASNPLHL